MSEWQWRFRKNEAYEWKPWEDVEEFAKKLSVYAEIEFRRNPDTKPGYYFFTKSQSPHPVVTWWEEPPNPEHYTRVKVENDE
jgi:hypothetical protein